MKLKWLPAIFLLLLFKIGAAQYCGFSGPQVCSPQLVDTGFYWQPVEADFPCIERGVPFNASVVIHVRDFTLTSGGQTVAVHLNSLRFDSVGNLPTGFCWSTNKVNNIGLSGDTLCVNIQGTTFDNVGEHALRFWLYASISLSLIVSDGIVIYRVRIIEPGTPCPDLIDGIQTNEKNAAAVSLQNNRLQIDAAAEESTVTLTDVLGRKLLEEKTKPHTALSIALDDIRGFFIVNISSSSNSYSKKFYR